MICLNFIQVIVFLIKYKLKLVMQIDSDASLLKAIEGLQLKQKINAQTLKQHYQSITEIYSTVNQVNKLLPKPIPAGIKVNKLMDEVLMDNAKMLTKNLKLKGSDSLFATAGNNLLDNALKMIVNKNKLKIKVYAMAVVKNIFK